LIFAIVLGGVLVFMMSAADRGAAGAQAQPQTACSLLTHDEIQALAPKQHVPDGVASTIASLDFATCRYIWGTGAQRVTLDVSLNPATRVYAGMTADAIKRGLASLIVPETADASIADVGQAAIFKVYSAVAVGASAYLNDRILQVSLEGIDAPEQKGQVISLLKSAASRLPR
jgi:hypothetical protein